MRANLCHEHLIKEFVFTENFDFAGG